jgi:hypothetical protein
MNPKALAVGAIGIFVVLSLVSPLSAAPVATKRAIHIDSRARGVFGGSGSFFLYMGTGGDLGKLTFTRSFQPKGEGNDYTAPDGQVYSIAKETDTLKGKKGTLVVRAVGPAYNLGIGDHEVWEGKWSIVRGTGAYSGLKGGGRYFADAAQIQPPVITKRSSGFVQH